jgi:hypothetical protein
MSSNMHPSKGSRGVTSDSGAEASTGLGSTTVNFAWFQSESALNVDSNVLQPAFATAQTHHRAKSRRGARQSMQQTTSAA